MKNKTKNILSLNFDQISHWLINRGEKEFRAKQLWPWLWAKRVKDFSLMTNLSKPLRKILAQNFCIKWPEVRDIKESKDGTVKFLLALEDEKLIETVLIPEKDHYTQCLSSQVGCSLACTFCSTGQMGFKRNMYSHEIAAQILVAQDYLQKKNSPKHLTNLVFMGMGEPLLNWKEVREALQIINHPLGLNFSRRKITLSTVGIKGVLQDFGQSKLALLAVSLHAPTQELREKIMPKAARWDLNELVSVLAEYPLARRERITIEYVLLGGVNDTPEHARQLVRLLSRVKCKINLIAYNPGPDSKYRAPEKKDILKFEQILWSKGMTAILRKSKGQDISAACGQLIVMSKLNS
ncbi:23S rRNA (adenine(2503)-C(2))-methyltransferase RlmN [Desulfohalobiaceae bacterium Ax17]|uniref:23S rRNA (adenine(2503)-C(2))-methyltransferase RlmN n=1 Tax=Desulfovulcanus ferrireducens TaxID=2831190 RepID=UPI00207BA9ED|nr:23S rRNA (adenine(2503)-C(2))-methyltransferase RlmN [Desulfovulcanus ferrireducens]MBT8762561.1 23S rRNA (adenine(2503)-C(2))-methyltransferase RlmN [Desulfovulcanus ferrireducens]